jgi:hypothetical protein
MQKASSKDKVAMPPNAGAVLRKLADQVDPEIQEPYDITIRRQASDTYVCRVTEHRGGDYEGYVVSLQD